MTELNNSEITPEMQSRLDSELRMSAYYYSFEPTGVPEIDMILSAVACAGKAFHHTTYWCDECYWPPHEGKSPVEWIQTAANRAADSIRRTRAIDSAAPDLLALAKRMLAAWEGSGPGIVLDDIRALIAKAEGRSDE